MTRDRREYLRQWRHDNSERRNAYQQRYRETTGSFTAPSTGAKWSAEEDAAVVAQDVPDRVLAAQLGRSLTAIQMRRGRLRRGSLSRSDRQPKT